MEKHFGELIALLTAVCWTITALAFQQATRKEGSLAVNLLRLVMALGIYSTITMVQKGTVIPLDAPAHTWIWLSVSGLIGFVFGDYFLFKSYEFISARIAMLVMSMSPPLAALISWTVLGESMDLKSLLAMFVTISGIMIVITHKEINREVSTNTFQKKYPNNIRFSFSKKGLFFALLGTIGQAGGLVISKYGMQDYEAFGSTFIRVITGVLGFIVLITILKRWNRVKKAVSNRSSMGFISIGAVFGPFLGVFFSLLAVKHTSVGIASTIMAIIPILIIPPAIILYKEKVKLREIIGSVIAIGGIMLFFL